MPNHFSSMPPLKLLIKLYAPAGERLAKRPEKPPYPSSSYVHRSSKLWDEQGRWIGSQQHSSYYLTDAHRPGLDDNPLGSWQKLEQATRKRLLLPGMSEPVAPRTKRSLPGGNLPKASYQFWIGRQNPKALDAFCRVCKKLCFGEEERKRHFEYSQCARIMMEAVKKWNTRELKLCSCGCAEYPKITCWGLGFRDLSCMEAFAFMEYRTSEMFRKIIEEEKAKTLVMVKA